MLRGKIFFIVVLFTALTIFSLWVSAVEGNPSVYYGKVVGTEFNVIQVRGDHGRISWFWMGHRTHFESRVPFFGDRVRIEYVKDRLGRNAVTRIRVLR
jgi:hypothetical protein